MRIMVDTNILISAIFFPNSMPAKFLEHTIDNHTIVLCSHIIDELHRVFDRKFKDKTIYLEIFLSRFSYQLVETPLSIEADKYPKIRGIADLPILVSAIIADVNIIVSGDKDFFGLGIEKPDIVTVKGYFEKYL